MRKQEREALIFTNIHRLRRQYPLESRIATCNNCMTEGCIHTVVGAGKCANCVEKDLAELIGKRSAETLHRLTRETANEIRSMLDD